MNYAIGFLIGFLVGGFGVLHAMLWTVLCGRITTRDIASACDKLIDEAEPEAVEPVQRRRVL